MPTIIVVGKSGVGKSTLINTILDKEIADVGIGDPVTCDFKSYKTVINNNNWEFIDTIGITNENYKDIYLEIKELIDENSFKRTIDVVWLCMEENSSRIEDIDTFMGEHLGKRIPLIVVLTKASSDNGMQGKIKNEIDMAKAIIRVNSIKANYGPYVLNISGIDELINKTEKIFVNSFQNLQKEDVSEETKDQLLKIVQSNVYSVSTLTISDEYLYEEILNKIQIGMFKTVLGKFKINLDEKYIENLIKNYTKYLNDNNIKNNIIILELFNSNKINIKNAEFIYNIGKLIVDTVTQVLKDNKIDKDINDEQSLYTLLLKNINGNNKTSTQGNIIRKTPKIKSAITSETCIQKTPKQSPAIVQSQNNLRYTTASEYNYSTYEKKISNNSYNKTTRKELVDMKNKPFTTIKNFGKKMLK